MKKKITNARGGKWFLHWTHTNKNGEFLREREIVIDRFALTQEVNFIDERDFECFKAQHKGDLETGALIIGNNVKETQAQKQSEKVNDQETQILQEKAEEAVVEPNIDLSSLQGSDGAVANIKVTTNKRGSK